MPPDLTKQMLCEKKQQKTTLNIHGKEAPLDFVDVDVGSYGHIKSTTLYCELCGHRVL